MASPLSLLIRRNYPDYYTTTEIASIIGRSKATVERWRKDHKLEPASYAKAGSTTVWLYDEANLAYARELAKNLKPGRKSHEG
jgi:hypothetical protein